MYYYRKTIKKLIQCTLILATTCFVIYDNQLCAETLRLQSQLSVITKKDAMDINLTLSNKGRATAYDIVSQIRFLGKIKDSPPIHCLSSGATETFSMRFDLQNNMKGDYPLIVEILYHDINLYPFYSMRCTPIHIHCPKQQKKLVVHVPDIEFSQQYNLNVQINNQGLLNKNVSVQVIVPGSFSCENNKQLRFLPIGQSVDLEYCIVKNNALPGSAHNGYVLVTYTDNTISHAQVTPFNIVVKPVSNFFFFNKRFVVSACIFFGLLWLLFMTDESLRNQKPGKIHSNIHYAP
jgi:hypothetical protein